jgi:hypothetical protein
LLQEHALLVGQFKEVRSGQVSATSRRAAPRPLLGCAAGLGWLLAVSQARISASA